MLREWTDTAIPFSTRVNNLRYGAGATGLNLLDNVFDEWSEDQIDMLQGSSGDDWFLFKAGDRGYQLAKAPPLKSPTKATVYNSMYKNTNITFDP